MYYYTIQTFKFNFYLHKFPVGQTIWYRQAGKNVFNSSIALSVSDIDTQQATMHIFLILYESTLFFHILNTITSPCSYLSFSGTDAVLAEISRTTLSSLNTQTTNGLRPRPTFQVIDEFFFEQRMMKRKRKPENTKALRCERTAKGFLIWIYSTIQCVNTQKPLAMKNNGFVLLLSICYQKDFPGSRSLDFTRNSKPC